MVKKIFSMLLVTVMVLGTMGTVVFAENTVLPAAVNGTITLTEDVELSAPVVISEDTVLELNGKKLSYESSVQGEAMITNKAKLTINDSVGGGEIVCTFVGTPDATYGKGNYTISNGGVLVVNGGAIKEASGAISHMRSAIDNNSCGSASAYATINGGEVISSNYIAIRQFAGGENKVTINGGTVTGGKRAVWMQAAGSTGAPVIELAVSGGKLVSNDKGENGYNLAVYSYSYGASFENVKINISGGEFDGDIALTGSQNSQTVAETVTVTGGKFNDIYSYAEDAVAKETIVIEGGEFAAGEYAKAYVADGLKLGTDGKVVVDVVYPDATVSKLEPFSLEAGSYLAWPSGDTNVKRPLDVVMCFEANDTLEEAQASRFGKWICDFYLTIDGLENGTALADGCYLAGEYGTYGWIVIPADGITLTNGETMAVVSAYDANLTYENICDYVKKFTAAIYINPQLVAANPAMTVTLELRMKNPETGEFYTVGQPYTYETPEFATDNAVTEVDGGVYSDGSAAVVFNTQFDEANILENATYGAFVYKKGNATGKKVALSSADDERYTSIIVDAIPAADFDEYIVCVPYMIYDNEVTLGNVRTVKASDLTKNLVK